MDFLKITDISLKDIFREMQGKTQNDGNISNTYYFIFT